MVVDQKKTYNGNHNADSAGNDENFLPHSATGKIAQGNECDSAANLWCGSKNAVESGSCGLWIPAGEGNGTRSGTHGLSPSVSAPKNQENHEKWGAADAREKRCAESYVDNRRDEKTRCHRAADIAVVGKETVDELAKSVHEENGAGNVAETLCAEKTRVNQRLLDNAKADAADVESRVAENDSDERLASKRLV